MLPSSQTVGEGEVRWECRLVLWKCGRRSQSNAVRLKGDYCEWASGNLGIESDLQRLDHARHIHSALPRHLAVARVVAVRS